MRENCTYGLMRGKGSIIVLSLLYSTDNLKEELTKDEELVKINKSLLDESCYTDDSLHLLSQDFVYCCITYLAGNDRVNDDESADDEVWFQNQIILTENRRAFTIGYWRREPERKMWEQFYKNGIAAIGWSEIGNLMAYSSRDAMEETLRQKFPNNKANTVTVH